MDSVCFIAMISMFAKVGTKDSLIKAEELFEKYLEEKSGIGIHETTFGVYGAMLEVYSKYGDIWKMERIWKEMTSGFVFETSETVCGTSLPLDASFLSSLRANC